MVLSAEVAAGALLSIQRRGEEIAGKTLEFVGTETFDVVVVELSVDLQPWSSLPSAKADAAMCRPPQPTWGGDLTAKLRPDDAERHLHGHGRKPGLRRVYEGNFEPLVDEATFYRAQAVLAGRVVVAGPRQRNHPDFLLRGFVRCETCGRSLTGSWSKGRNGHYAYYHCQRQCRAVNVSKAVLEGEFVDELALLQPTPGYMRLVKDRILHVWEQHQQSWNQMAAWLRAVGSLEHAA